jgi:hypothetical protein
MLGITAAMREELEVELEETVELERGGRDGRSDVLPACIFRTFCVLYFLSVVDHGPPWHSIYRRKPCVKSFLIVIKQE